MNANVHLLELHAAPHVHRKSGINAIMYHVILALLPLCAFSVWQFGLSALALIVTSTVACLLAEAFFSYAAGRASRVSDGSAAIAGLLLALTLPPGFPLWMAALGGVIAIGLGKALFGGLGSNVFNPALVGRAFLQLSFPLAITTWTPAFAEGRFTALIPSTFTLPFSRPPAMDAWIQAHGVDGFSGATPLSLQKFSQTSTATLDLLLGSTAGATGETCALLILLAGIFLIARRIVNWRVPVAILGSAFLVSAAFYAADSAQYPSPIFTVLSGGLMLGAFFMATDMASSPVTPCGTWVYGILIGLFTVIIRLQGNLPEGIMYAILLGNALTPLIDQWTQPRIFGQRKAKHG